MAPIVKRNCSACGVEIERSASLANRHFTCFDCKQKRRVSSEQTRRVAKRTVMHFDLIPSKFAKKTFKANCKKCGEEVERTFKNKTGYKCDKCRDEEVKENARKHRI